VYVKELHTQVIVAVGKFYVMPGENRKFIRVSVQEMHLTKHLELHAQATNDVGKCFLVLSNNQVIM
jgi:hypothetical protein